VAAVLSLAAILRKFGKKVSAIISDPLPQNAQFLDAAGLDKGLSGMRDFVLKLDVTKAEVDKLRYEVQDGKLNIFITPFKGGFAPSDVTFGYGDFHYDLAIILGVPSRARIDRVYGENQGLFSSIPVVNVDFHRTNENYGAINLIEPTASSLCEILVALSESLQSGMIDAEIATVMLAGLMSSTDRFTATHTTSKSLTVAAQMMAAGARQQTVVKGLYQSRGERSDRPNGSDNRGAGARTERNDRTEVRSGEQRASEPRGSEQRGGEQRAPEQIEPVVAIVAEEIIEPVQVVESVIEPDHIEVEPTAEAPSQPLPMADFASAAEVLETRPQPEDTQR
jgi:hypothetical protein